MENLIGRKIKGFKFEASANLSYNEKMNYFIGKIGKIKGVFSDYVMINFGCSSNWAYPLDQIQPHLVEETQTLGVGTLMWVWNDCKIDECKRFVFGKAGSGFLSWSNAEKEEDISFKGATFWKNAKPIIEPEFIHLTKQDICDGKGVGVNPSLIKIID